MGKLPPLAVYAILVTGQVTSAVIGTSAGKMTALLSGYQLVLALVANTVVGVVNIVSNILAATETDQALFIPLQTISILVTNCITVDASASNLLHPELMLGEENEEYAAQWSSDWRTVDRRSSGKGGSWDEPAEPQDFDAHPLKFKFPCTTRGRPKSPRLQSIPSNNV